MNYVKISSKEDDKVPIELPIEEDGTLLFSTLEAQFPGVCGLKYQNEDTKASRGVRFKEDRFYPPATTTGWGETTIYICVFPRENKRKHDENLENPTAKTKRVFETHQRSHDLIVLGISFTTTEESLRKYFEQYGDVVMTQVKKDFQTGKSKGFGFVRFESYDSQLRVLAERHSIDGRWCVVKIPTSKVVQHLSSKMFIGRCTEDITADDLRKYFSEFGIVIDVYIPHPFRACAFVTFSDPEIAQYLSGQDHIIKGVSVHVKNAVPKTDNGNNFRNSKTNNSLNGNGGWGQSMNNNQNRGYGGDGQNHRMNNEMMGGSGSNGGSNGNVDGNSLPYVMNDGGTNSCWNRNMTNMQTGVNSQTQSPNTNQAHNMNNSNNKSDSLNSMSMNTAFVAAALNQLGRLAVNFQSQSQQDQGLGVSNDGPNSQLGSINLQGSFLSWLAQGGCGGGSAAIPPGNK